MSQAKNKLALVLGVANKRSIAWACVESFLEANFDCILTYQSSRFRPKLEQLVNDQSTRQGGRVLAQVECDVTQENALERLFQTDLGDILRNQGGLNAVVHSIAYANFEGNAAHISQASWEAYAQAQRISAYSVLELARHAQPYLMQQPNASLTALSYLGATRAVPNYHIMGPAKASLESIVRGLALEFGENGMGLQGRADSDGSPAYTEDGIIRVNAVSAGPINTAAARGIPGFSSLLDSTRRTSPLGSVTPKQVADTVRFLAVDGTGITGQTIHVDGGFSNVVGI